MEASAETDPNLKEERASFGKKHPSVNGGTQGGEGLRTGAEPSEGNRNGMKKGLGRMESHNMNGRSSRVTEVHGHKKHFGVK